ncbi:FAD binding domain-containing protein [Paenibacillus sp. D51F]
MAVQSMPGMQPALLKPMSLQEAWLLRAGREAAAVPVAGGSLLRTQWENGAPLPPYLLDLRGIPGLADIAADSEGVLVGSQATLAAVKRSAPIRERWPLLHEAVGTIGGPGIRNLGTLGGNAASAIGDSLPALLALEAALLWYDGAGLAEQPLDEWLDERRSLAEPERRLLAGIRLRESRAEPQAAGGWHCWRKVGRRESFTPSLVSFAATGTMLPEQGGQPALRLAAGGGSCIPQRLRLAERAALGAIVGGASAAEAAAAVHAAALAEFLPAGDVFADADYRRRTAANLAAAAVWEAWSGS